MFARNIATPFAALLLMVAGAISATPSPIVARGESYGSKAPACNLFHENSDSLHFVALDQGSGLTRYLYSTQTGQRGWYFPSDKRLLLTQNDPAALWTIFAVTAHQGPNSKTITHIKIDGKQECNLPIDQATSLDIEVFNYYGR